MPSQINNPGNIGYAEGLTVSANYLKASASTRFATRDLAFFVIDVVGAETTPEASDSVYSRAVRAVQVVAEMYAVGAVTSAGFVAVVADDTMPDSGPGFGTDASPTQAERLTAALVDAGLTVTTCAKKTLSGAGLA